MADSQENSYDVIPYDDKPYHFTHPRHLETLATLFGMSPKLISECRVLELGCGGGWNIIPMAIDLPDSRFLGIDLSERQIEQGRKLVTELGIDNIQLRQVDILDVDECWGEFDYIICHGVISWVPEYVKEKIFEICNHNLAPQGVAFISYNAYPGWHRVQAVRDLMLYHVRHIDDPREKIAQARSVLHFMAKVADTDQAAGKLYEEEQEMLEKAKNDAHLFHDHLESQNQPFYFHEFVSRAELHGLRYISSTSLKGMLPRFHPPEIRKVLEPLSLVEQEQYLDFICGTRFRQTLLCHEEVTVNRALDGKQIMGFHLALTSLPEKVEVDIRNDEEVVFKNEDGTLKTGNRLSKAAVIYLKEVFPAFVHFDKLYETVINRLGISPRQAQANSGLGPEALASSIMLGVCVGMFKPCLHPPRYVGQLSSCPNVGLLPRLQAARGDLVTSRLHLPVRMNDVMRHVVRRLDGSHGRKDLVESVREAVDSGEIAVTSNGKKVHKVATADIATVVDKTLQDVVKMGLLTG